MCTATLLLICTSLATAAPAPLMVDHIADLGPPRRADGINWGLAPTDRMHQGPDQTLSNAAPSVTASAQQPEDWDKHHSWDQLPSDAASSATASAQKPAEWDHHHGKHSDKHSKHGSGHGHAKGWSKREELASGEGGMKGATGGFNSTEHNPHKDNHLNDDHDKHGHHKHHHHEGDHEGDHHKHDHHKGDHHEHEHHKPDHHKPDHHKPDHHQPEAHKSHPAEALTSHTAAASKTHASESHKSFSVPPQHTSLPTAPIANHSGEAHVSAGGNQTELDEKFKKLRELLQAKANGKDGLRRTDTGSKNHEHKERSLSSLKEIADHDRAMMEYQFGGGHISDVTISGTDKRDKEASGDGGMKALEQLVASRGLPDVDYSAIQAELGHELLPPGIHRGGVGKRGAAPSSLDFLLKLLKKKGGFLVGFRQRSEESKDDGGREAFEQLLKSRGLDPEEVKEELNAHIFTLPDGKQKRQTAWGLKSAIDLFKPKEPVMIKQPVELVH